jgi:hypothetical protein
MVVGPVCAAIRNDEARFRELRVEAGTLVWPAAPDLCPNVLICGGLPPADAASDVARAELFHARAFVPHFPLDFVDVIEILG